MLPGKTIQKDSKTGRLLRFLAFFRLFFTKGLPHARVCVAWKRPEVGWKGLMLKFSRKNFRVFCNFFFATISLRFLVRVIWSWDGLGILSLNGPFSSIFRKIGHFQKDLEKPHSVTWCCNTAHLKGFYSYFNSKTEKSCSSILNPSNPPMFAV